MISDSADKPSVLVVDDNEQNRLLAQATLEDEGYQVVLAASGAEALSTFARLAPDCVLLDVRMPGMNGFEVCAKIRALPNGGDVPVVFLTAQRDVDTFDSALGAGGDDFLTKPVRPTELLIRVQAAVRLRRLHASNREYFELARKQRDDLMRLQLQKERLTEFVVHDLKNPVATVDLLAQVLLRDKDLPPEARESATGIRDEARALMRLILNLLDISKSEEGKLLPTLTEVDLEKLSADVLEALRARAQDRGVKLANGVEGQRVRVDPDLMRRVLENLVENAVRHAPRGSSVRLSAKFEASSMELRVADSGVGIPAELKESIFDRFVQLESHDAASRSGRGLGLTFCRLAVEAHGGSIHVEDALPGAVFCVRLPHAG